MGLPKWISTKKACINIFQILRSINILEHIKKEKTHPERMTHFQDIKDQLVK